MDVPFPSGFMKMFWNEAVAMGVQPETYIQKKKALNGTYSKGESYEM